MAIYIEGLEMPKDDCTACREIIITNNYIGDGKTRIYVYDAQTNNFIGEAIEIPEPHGRLIDADALENNNCELWRCDFSHPRYGDTLEDIIGDAPTVIEGSGQDEPN